MTKVEWIDAAAAILARGGTWADVARATGMANRRTAATKGFRYGLRSLNRTGRPQGFRMSDESRAKVSAGRKGHEVSATTRMRISAALRARQARIQPQEHA